MPTDATLDAALPGALDNAAVPLLEAEESGALGGSQGQDLARDFAELTGAMAQHCAC